MYLSNFDNNSTGNVFERNIVYYTAPDAVLMVTGDLNENVIHLDKKSIIISPGQPGIAHQHAPGIAQIHCRVAKTKFRHELDNRRSLLCRSAEGQSFSSARFAVFKQGFKATDTRHIGLRRRL